MGWTEVATPERLLERESYVLFEENKTELPAEEGAWLFKWWDSLHPQTREALQKADRALVLKGYAGTTGPSTNNMTVAAGRIASVLKLLNEAAGMKGGKSLLKQEPETHTYGENKDVNPSDDRRFETPAKYSKRVEVSVDDLMRGDPDDNYAQVEFMLLGREIRLRQEQVELEHRAIAP